MTKIIFYVKIKALQNFVSCKCINFLINSAKKTLIIEINMFRNGHPSESIKSSLHFVWSKIFSC